MEKHSQKGGILLLIMEGERLHLLPILLEREGYPVHQVGSLSRAEGWVKRHSPRVIIHSMDRFGAAQIQFYRALKAKSPGQGFEILLLLASPDSAQLDIMRSLGLMDYVTKPFLYPRLLERVRALAGQGHGDRGGPCPPSHIEGHPRGEGKTQGSTREGMNTPGRWRLAACAS